MFQRYFSRYSYCILNLFPLTNHNIILHLTGVVLSWIQHCKNLYFRYQLQNTVKLWCSVIWIEEAPAYLEITFNRIVLKRRYCCFLALIMKYIFLQCDLSRQLKYTSLKWIFVLREECMHHVKSFCKSALSRCKLFPECKNAQNVQSKIIWNFHWKLVYTLIRLFIIYCFALQICNIVSTIMQVNTNGALLLEALDLLIECI